MIATVTRLRPSREPAPTTTERREAPTYEVVNSLGRAVFTAAELDLAERHASRVPGLRIELVERITKRTVIEAANQRRGA